MSENQRLSMLTCKINIYTENTHNDLRKSKTTK